MAFTDINSEDRLVQKTFAEHLENALGWESVYAWNDETFGPDGTLGRARHARGGPRPATLRAALGRLNPELPSAAVDEAVRETDPARLLPLPPSAQPRVSQFIRDGVPVSYRDAAGQLRQTRGPGD